MAYMTTFPTGVVLDEISDQAAVKIRADKARGDQNRRHQRKAIREACPHLERRWAQVPHPRYGDRVPYFVSYVAKLPQPHPCVAAR